MQWKVPDGFWDEKKVERCKTTLPDAKPAQKKATERSKSVLENKLPTTNDLLGDLNVSERRIILKSIILNEWNGEQDTLNKIMSPEAKRVAQKWLQRAKPRDKDFAMALDGEEQKWLIDQGKKPGFSKKSGENRLQYINLLKPKERQDQWSHCTWHHLPVYGATTTNEHPGAMFQSLHKPQPVEYVLHPEIG
ncbi:hypothetical protein Ciccas_010687 [Cichlidogyrus casuarinus]|uniref:Uncharacterized protein n=1 Tax=Cichlidogyrus casuarinus TaxID=1844966 RepID=A0ABD2PTE3_9PLAT